MFQYIVGRRDEISETVYQQLARYRHTIFVGKLGWRLPNVVEGATVEEDEFDTESTIYVVALFSDAADDDRKIVGCARLLPTTRPYLLGSVFPALLDGRPIPCSDKIWEVSRFAISHTSFHEARQLCSRISQVVTNNHAEYIVGVLSCGTERCLTRLGVPVERLCEPRDYDGQRIVAFQADNRHGLAPIAESIQRRTVRPTRWAPPAAHEVPPELSLSIASARSASERVEHASPF
jgi:acyl homoserine lactone synthase